MKKTIILALAAGAIVAALAIPGMATARKPNSASIAVPDGVFGGVTTATANPGGDSWVHVRCYNEGGVAMEAWKKVDANNQATFQLGPTPSWSSGGASCEAEEGYFAKRGFKVLAKTTFEVAP